MIHENNTEKQQEILPTANAEWGFWGTSQRNGCDAALAWNAASQFLIGSFDLTAEQARDVLDARFGRHLADDLSFIKGALTAETIAAHLKLRIADADWRTTFENAIRDVTGKTFPRAVAPTKAELLSLIAEEHLRIETLETRNADGLDFHDLAVWSLKEALDAAFEAGRKARK
jgi:hypothetical protein